MDDQKILNILHQLLDLSNAINKNSDIPIRVKLIIGRNLASIEKQIKSIFFTK